MPVHTILQQAAKHGGNLGILHECALASVPLVRFLGNDHGLRGSSGPRIGIRDWLSIERSGSEVFGGLHIEEAG
jgi:hypothetical protein